MDRARSHRLVPSVGVAAMLMGSVVLSRFADSSLPLDFLIRPLIIVLAAAVIAEPWP